MFLNTARFHMMAIDEASRNVSFFCAWLNVCTFYFVAAVEVDIMVMSICICSLLFLSFVL